MKVDTNAPEFQTETLQGKEVLKATLKLLALDPEFSVTLGGIEWVACFRDGLFRRKGSVDEFHHLGEVLVLSYPRVTSEKGKKKK